MVYREGLVSPPTGEGEKLWCVWCVWCVLICVLALVKSLLIWYMYNHRTICTCSCLTIWFEKYTFTFTRNMHMHRVCLVHMSIISRHGLM